MHVTAMIVALVAVVSAVADTAPAQTNAKSSSQPGGTIKGVVLDARTNEPVRWTNVAINSRFGAIALNDGSFVIPDVPPGKHTIGAGTIGYHWVTIEDVVVESGRETTLPNILLNVCPPTSGLRITRHDTRKWWLGDPETYHCTYEGLTKPHAQARHAPDLSADELDLLTHFYNEIVLEWIFPLNREHEVTNPLPVLVSTWSGFAIVPGDSFFAGISTDSLRAVGIASVNDQAFYCVLKLNQQVSPDTLEVEASLNGGSRGIGRRALATRRDGRWSFCLENGIFTMIGCGPRRGSE